VQFSCAAGFDLRADAARVQCVGETPTGCDARICCVRQPIALQFLTVSDWHGRLDPTNGVGGASAISAYWKRDRAAPGWPNMLQHADADGWRRLRRHFAALVVLRGRARRPGAARHGNPGGCLQRELVYHMHDSCDGEHHDRTRWIARTLCARIRTHPPLRTAL
jgi:hypothetical protein